jgi:competence protein ComEA
MLSVSPSNIKLVNMKLAVAFTLMSATALAQLPEGAGKAETEKVCSQCHELARAISLRQDRVGWAGTVDKMVSLGAAPTEAEQLAIINYLSSHFTADAMPPINVNKARAIELESGLSLKRSEAAAVIEYRTKNGPFKSLADLKKVPGIDFAKIEAKKDRLVFEDKP